MKITKRISDAEVNEWLIERVKELRKESDMNISAADLHVSFYYPQTPRIRVNMHCNGECVVNCPTLTEAVTQLSALVPNTKARIAKKREQAQALLNEAEAMEKGSQ